MNAMSPAEARVAVKPAPVTNPCLIRDIIPPSKPCQGSLTDLWFALASDDDV